jgi:hypothetical protein
MRINSITDLRQYYSEQLHALDQSQYTISVEGLIKYVASRVMDRLKEQGFQYGDEISSYDLPCCYEILHLLEV